MTRRVRIPYHVPGSSSNKYLYMDVDIAGGVASPSGASGTSWFTGTGAPPDGTGANGDFYIDTYAGAYYGPKAAGTWSGTGPNSFGGSSGWTPTPHLYTTPGTYQLTISGSQAFYAFVTATAAGGAGGGGYSASGGPGGGGGGPGLSVEMMPLLLDPTISTTLTIVVGTGGAGVAKNTDGNNGTETYFSGTCIVSPFKDTNNKVSLGYGLGGKKPASSSVGGDGGGVVWSADTATLPIDTLNTGNAHAAKSLCVANGNMNYQWMHTIFQPPGGGGFSGSGQNCGTVLRTINGMGCGAIAGTQADGTGGAGSPGGGTSASMGGTQGSPSSPTGGNAVTAGGGGGGGFSNAGSGSGGNGRVLILV